MPNRVAVIVRTKDRPVFLRRALADIAAQTFEDAAIIVVNDGGSREVVDQVVADSATAARTVVLDTAAPGGRCAAANAGMRAADAPYVVLHDDDDLWHPEFLSRTVAVLDASPTDAGVMTATEIVYEEQRGEEWVETARVPFWEGLSAVGLSTLLEMNRAVPISFLYRRTLHDEVGYYDEGIDAVEDWEFYLRVTAKHPVSFLGGTALAYWTQRPGTRGPAGNSMFELADAHERDDLAVRDAALREWVHDNGLGLPLFIGLLERRRHEDLDRLRDELLSAQRDMLIRELDARHPIWSRIRRLLGRAPRR
ncbi:glycosyltransferase family A protein [Microbacterium sp. BK668]|uniref:glycosyltransferase family 2 protein n=1 Tax=Microbacterium sp. BK668 TaxID=2512118 RepID=UPI00105E7AA0|nr:glycosyltransferase family A protein [Microbacterium sp. BK668]TDN87868.1 glycosyl transferase family 2 [Microbacterium sp. BK668]